MDAQPTLTVMSANLWNLNEPLAERMGRFSAMVADVKPDLIAMQEVCPTPGSLTRLQVELVDALAGYELFYTVAHATQRDLEGLAIASRVPPDEARSYPLPGGGAAFEPARVVQYVRIRWGTGWLGVFNTHLAYHHSSEPLRVRQAEFIGDLARQLAELRPYDGLVLCGDLNATPTSAPVARLQSRAGLDNPWLALSQHRYSFAATNPYLGGDPDQDSWLDYILTRDVVPVSLRLLDDWPDGPASDHYFPVMRITRDAARPR